MFLILPPRQPNDEDVKKREQQQPDGEFDKNNAVDLVDNEGAEYYYQRRVRPQLLLEQRNYDKQFDYAV